MNFVSHTVCVAVYVTCVHGRPPVFGVPKKCILSNLVCFSCSPFFWQPQVGPSKSQSRREKRAPSSYLLCETDIKKVRRNDYRVPRDEFKQSLAPVVPRECATREWTLILMLHYACTTQYMHQFTENLHKRSKQEKFQTFYK